MSSRQTPPSLPSDEALRKLAGRELDALVSVHILEGRTKIGAWTLDDAREAEEIVIRKLGLPAYAGALMELLDRDVSRAIVASPQHRLRACLFALKRDAEDTTR
jgi:hypothetical protein